jgi:patatin-like phospholipase/acyl hydrolase
VFTDRRANSLQTRREKQPWPADRPFKILSLDGGGIRGIYTAELLRHCEEAFGRGSGIERYFDMIAGTSTGGIIALGLGLGIPMDDIVAFYTNDGRKIFPPLPVHQFGRWTRFFRSSQAPSLDHEALERALKERFEGRLLWESIPRLVIPAFMMPKAEIAVFKTDHHKDFRNDHATPMWQVARATSAAPTYLKGLEHFESGKIFIDGGVWANNPAMIALVDALTDYDLTLDQIEVLSIGTGNAPLVMRAEEVLGGWLAWHHVIDAAMFLTTDNATAQVKLLLGPDRCVRLEPKGDHARIELDDYQRAFTVLPNVAIQDFEESRGIIASFFANKVCARERHYPKQ